MALAIKTLPFCDHIGPSLGSLCPTPFLGVQWKKKKKRWRALHHGYCFHVLNGKLMVNSERFVKILLKLDCLWKVND